MNATETSNGRFTENLSLLTCLCWVPALGLGGFLLLCLLAYAMVTENLALGVVCGMLLAVPYILGVIWFCTVGTSVCAERVPEKAEELVKAEASN
jgi:fatty acid desaturase